MLLIMVWWSYVGGWWCEVWVWSHTGAPPPAAAAPPPQAAAGSYNMVGTPAVSNSGSVIMLYGLSATRTNCDTVFNLLCSYGNVLKVLVVERVCDVGQGHM